MKAYILFSIIFLPALAFAQFPAPDSLNITVRYIFLGESDWCDNQLIQGPNYCNVFGWEAPDTANVQAMLTEYRIYKDNVLFQYTPYTQVDTAGAYWGSYYVTAIYENPAGESAPSNVVVISDLPFAAGEAEGEGRFRIGFDRGRQMLVIKGVEYARTLRVYDMRGRLVLFTDDIQTFLRLEGLTTGIYFVVIQDRSGGNYSELIFTEY